jgi:predicted ATPase
VVSAYSPKGIHLLLLRFPKGPSLPFLVKLLLEGDPSRRSMVESYIRLMVPGFVRFEMESAGGREWVVFLEKTGNVEEKFYVTQISDGTLYAAQILLDLFVRGIDNAGNLPVLVEEPGGSLHPWAAGVLRSALEEAATERQVIVTTHSPDLIDGSSISADSLRAVYRDASGTHIEKLGDGAIALLQEGVCTPGDLLRRGALTSDNEPEFVPYIA